MVNHEGLGNTDGLAAPMVVAEATDADVAAATSAAAASTPSATGTTTATATLLRPAFYRLAHHMMTFTQGCTPGYVGTAFMLYGPAGSGKSTTLWQLVRSARQILGYTVLYIGNGELSTVSRDRPLYFTTLVFPGADFVSAPTAAMRSVLEEFNKAHRAALPTPAAPSVTDLVAVLDVLCIK